MWLIILQLANYFSPHYVCDVSLRTPLRKAHPCTLHVISHTSLLCSEHSVPLHALCAASLHSMGGVCSTRTTQNPSSRFVCRFPALTSTQPPTQVSGGYLRLGGTYTDYLHYAVPGANVTSCPLPADKAKCGGYTRNLPTRDGAGPCCLTLTMERWVETLDFAYDVGVKVRKSPCCCFACSFVLISVLISVHCTEKFIMHSQKRTRSRYYQG